MYPVLFRIGDFEVTSFGVLVAIGSLVGLWMFRRELRLSGLPDEGVDAAVAGIIGGLAGAKLLWVLEHLGEESVGDLLLSRGGMSWFGRRSGRPARFVLGAYLVLAGVIRFAIEFLRVNERVLGALSVAHVASIGVIVMGGTLLLENRRRTLQGELRPREHHA